MAETDQQASEDATSTQDRRKEEMSPTPDNAASPSAVIERAQEGKEILGARVATGEPGQKQPKHDDPNLSASKTVEKLNDIVKQFEAPTYGPSDKRAQESGNPHPVAPEDRSIQGGDQVLQAAGTAAAAIGTARDHLTRQLEADARLVSDPRYERDQKVYELGVQGKLDGIAPAPAEAAAQAARAGLPPEVAELTPKTPEEQVAQDMPRLEEVEARPNANVAATQVEPGKQDMADKNNGLQAEREGRTGAAAVAKAKAADSAGPSTPPSSTPIK
jgi:hypothetical protein